MSATSDKPSKPPTLISACLLGARCRYDGRSVPANLQSLEQTLPVCPEMMAGFGVPRPAIERGPDGRVRVLATGADVTDELTRASEKIVVLAQRAGVTEAVLKERSPSCGCHQLTRNNRVIQGSGVLTDALRRAGIRVRSDEECR